jgi:hypothetical protein
MLSDLDISSNCSEVSELFDEVDCTDPCDWFLDEVFFFFSPPPLFYSMIITNNQY